MTIDLANWKTTIGGVLLFLGQVIVLTPLATTYPWLSTFLTGAGGLLLGLTAKDYSTHSTQAEVTTATVAARKAGG